jgi:hypothetical protein
MGLDWLGTGEVIPFHNRNGFAKLRYMGDIKSE